MTAVERDAAGAAGDRRRVSDRVLELATDRLRIMGEPGRVRILWHLERHGCSSVTEICDALGRTLQNVSKHLAILYTAGLVSRTREGNSMRYELVDWTALWVVEKTIASVSAQLEEQHEQLTQDA